MCSGSQNMFTVPENCSEFHNKYIVQLPSDNIAVRFGLVPCVLRLRVLVISEMLTQRGESGRGS